MFKGDAFAMLNRTEEAEAALRAACAAARLGEMPPTLWRAHLSLAKVLRSQGRDAEAAQEFAAAADLIEELLAPISSPATPQPPSRPPLQPSFPARRTLRGAGSTRKSLVGLPYVSWTSPG